jgi:nucleotide-binding universal stress UspA family protein
VALEVVHAWLPRHQVRPTSIFTDREPARLAPQALVSETVDRLRSEVPDLGKVWASAPREHPARALLCAAVGAELLVVGSSGGGWPAPLLPGSVGDCCLAHAPCPVTVVPTTMTNAPRDRVVVGVDGSAPSEEALAWAAWEANLRGAPLHVVHAWAPDIRTRDASEQVSRTLLEEMADLVADERDGGPPALVLQSVAGSPAHALLKSAAHAELLVVGGRSRRRLPGSVGGQCAHHAPCPTVVVRGSSRREPVTASAARHTREP